VNKKQSLMLWGILYIIIIFILTGIFGVLFHDAIPSEGPVVFKFVYAGLLNIWDTVLALIIGGYLVHIYHKKGK